MQNRKTFVCFSVAACLLFAHGISVGAEQTPGVTETEIRIGNTTPYSGPAAGFAPVGKAMAAYFQKVNDEGGVNGRKITFISRDDSFSPPRTVEETRRLVESDGVWAIVGAFGSSTSKATQKYLNNKKVPSVLINSGASAFAELEKSPWSQSFQPTNFDKGVIYAQYVIKNYPDAKVGILFQNDDFGRDTVMGFRYALGKRAETTIVKELGYEPADPTVDSQLLSLRAAGTTVLLDIATIKFTAQAIRKLSEMQWKPAHLISDAAASIQGVLEPAGLDNSVGVLTQSYRIDPSDPLYTSDTGMREYRAFMAKYMPTADPLEGLYGMGYQMAAAFVNLVRLCGNDLSRENLMRQVANIKNMKNVPLMRPGIEITTSPKHPSLFQQLIIDRFDGKKWVAASDVLSAR